MNPAIVRVCRWICYINVKCMIAANLRINFMNFTRAH